MQKQRKTPEKIYLTMSNGHPLSRKEQQSRTRPATQPTALPSRIATALRIFLIILISFL
jgi:hypothetical protein